ARAGAQKPPSPDNAARATRGGVASARWLGARGVPLDSGRGQASEAATGVGDWLPPSVASPQPALQVTRSVP
ncbi:hypothetical protein P7K49_026851, partial [Saguinus oedipus]